VKLESWYVVYEKEKVATPPKKGQEIQTTNQTNTYITSRRQTK